MTPPEQRYELRDELGRGGQSVVRVARDTHLDRDVAFKQLVVAGRGAERFVREARLTARLEHPGIVSLHDLGRLADGSYFATQKLIRGDTLTARLARCHTLADRLPLLRNFVDVCYAVGYAHDLGVVHRDLKPDNVMIGAFGETVVLDWGIARAGAREPEVAEAPEPAPEAGPEAETRMGTILGTPGYMPPEQARGRLHEITPRSDVWSLGAILHELLSGRRAIQGEGSVQKLLETAQGPVPSIRLRDPSVPPELTAIVDRALAYDASRRYPDARALAVEIESWRSGLRVAAYTYSTRELLARFVRRHKAATALAGLLVLGAGVAAGLILRERNDAVRARDAALAAQAAARTNEAVLYATRARTRAANGEVWAAAADYAEAAARGESAVEDEAAFGAALLGARALPVVAAPECGPFFSPGIGVDKFSMSPDGALCGAKLPGPGLAAVWRMGDDALPRPLAGPEGVRRVEFSESGGELLVFGPNAVALLPAWAVDRVLREIPCAVACSTGTVETATGAVYVGDVEGRIRRADPDGTVWPVAALPTREYIETLAPSPAGGRLLAVAESGTYVFDVASGAIAARLGLMAWPAQWLPDGRRVLVSDLRARSGISLWDTETGALTPLSDHRRFVSGLALDVDGAGYFASADDGGEVRLTDLETGRTFQRFALALPLQLVPRAGVGRLRAVGVGGRALDFDVSRAGLLRPLAASPTGSGPRGGVVALAVADDGGTLAFADADGHYGFAPLGRPGGLERRRLLLPDGRGNRVRALAFRPGGHSLALGVRDGVLSATPGEAELRTLLAFDAPEAGGAGCALRGLAWSRDAGRLYLACANGRVLMFSAPDGRLLAQAAPLGVSAPGDVFDRGGLAERPLAPAVIGDVLYVADRTGRVVELDAIDLRERRRVQPVTAGADDFVVSLTATPDAAELVLAQSRTPDLLLLDAQGLAPSGRLPTGAGGSTPTVHLARTGLWVTGGSESGVSFRRRDTAAPLFESADGAFEDVLSLAASPDERWLVVGDARGVITRLPLP